MHIISINLLTALLLTLFIQCRYKYVLLPEHKHILLINQLIYFFLQCMQTRPGKEVRYF